MGGIMCTAKEVTDTNKSYLDKRWKALCASMGMTDNLDISYTDTLTSIIIDAQPSLYQTDVGNRVTQINEVVNAEHWRYVPSAHNPADPLSRGVGAGELVELQI